MAFRRTVHIILNPIAGARHRGLLHKVIARLEAAGAQVSVQETQRAGHGVELARDAAKTSGADVIVAAGGDGTINEVARGLLGREIPLGIIPLGTANVLAVELGLGARAARVADTLLEGSAHLAGTGLVDGRLFLLMVGAGFDGAVVHGIDPRLKRLSGKGAFVWAGLKTWAGGPGRRIELKVDGRREMAAWVIITNARHYAGPYVLAPQTDISQPGLYALLFRRGGRWAFVRYLAALVLGRVGHLADVDVMPARRVELIAPEDVPVEVDGDAHGYAPKTVERGVQYLRLVVPADYQATSDLK